MFRRSENTYLALIVATAIVLCSSAASAQTPTAPTRWQAWVGCWRLAEAGSQQRVCVLPSTTPSAVSIVTVDSSTIVSRHTVDASGARQSIDRDGCAGWERASWSKDSLRVFLASELACDGAIKRTSTGLMSLTAGGQWVDVQTLKVASNEMVRTSRYVPVVDTAGLPAEAASAVASSQRLGARTAVLAAGGRVSVDAVVEASRMLDTTVVQAWLVERRQDFQLDGKMLIALADAGVPGSVTDVLVALSYPEQFRVDRGAMEAPTLMRSDSARIASSYLWDRSFDCGAYGYAPFGWGPSRSCYRYGLMYQRYGYGVGYGYGYDSFYPGYYGYYTRPIVIVRGDTEPRGVAVNGQGYTRSRGSSSSGGASSRSEGSSASSGAQSSGSSSSGSGSGSSSSGSSSSSSGSSSSGRTAKTRPPS